MNTKTKVALASAGVLFFLIGIYTAPSARQARGVALSAAITLAAAIVIPLLGRRFPRFAGRSTQRPTRPKETTSKPPDSDVASNLGKAVIVLAVLGGLLFGLLSLCELARLAIHPFLAKLVEGRDLASFELAALVIVVFALVRQFVIRYNDAILARLTAFGAHRPRLLWVVAAAAFAVAAAAAFDLIPAPR